MATTRRDRLTNVRITDPCPTCHGAGALLPLPSGTVVSALMVVPNRRLWSRLPICPCPVCGQSGREPRNARPARWGEG